MKLWLTGYLSYFWRRGFIYFLFFIFATCVHLSCLTLVHTSVFVSFLQTPSICFPLFFLLWQFFFGTKTQLVMNYKCFRVFGFWPLFLALDEANAISRFRVKMKSGFRVWVSREVRRVSGARFARPRWLHISTRVWHELDLSTLCLWLQASWARGPLGILVTSPWRRRLHQKLRARQADVARDRFDKLRHSWQRGCRRWGRV